MQSFAIFYRDFLVYMVDIDIKIYVQSSILIVLDIRIIFISSFN